MSDPHVGDTAAAPPQRYTRRLSDKILSGFHLACDQGDLEVAERLLTVLELILTRSPPVRKRLRDIDILVMAHERLWNLRHPTIEEYRTFG